MIGRALCWMGVHGPEWFGYGAGVGSMRNQSKAPGHRACGLCGAQWLASEGVGNGPYRVLVWQRINSHDDRRQAAARQESVNLEI